MADVPDVASPRPAAPAPSRRTQPPDVRRQQLLDAAEQVLLTRGLADTTVAEVARVAGVAKGTMYLYFESKNELLVALRDRYLQQFARVLDVTAGSARDRIHGLVLGFFEFAAKSHDLHHVLFHEAGFSEQDAFTRLRTWLVQLIADGVASGELTKTDPELAAAFVLAGMHGVLVETLHGNEQGDPITVARQLATLIDQTLAVP